MSLKEFFLLPFLYLKVKFVNLFEFIKVIFRYYSNNSFMKWDLALLSSYLFVNPFRLSKKFLQTAGEEEIYTYGETPLTTLEEIAKKCEIKPTDTVIEMGCGRGRGCFWLHQFIHCRVIGLEYIPQFVEKAQRIKEQYHIEGVEFRLADYFQAELSEATVIYLYGTCLSSDEIILLSKRFRQLLKGTKIITVSYSLKEYDLDAPFKMIKYFPAKFTWGKTMVFLQQRL